MSGNGKSRWESDRRLNRELESVSYEVQRSYPALTCPLSSTVQVCHCNIFFVKCCNVVMC